MKPVPLSHLRQRIELMPRMLLESLAFNVVYLLYHVPADLDTGEPGGLDQDKEWSGDTLELVADHVEAAGLHPSQLPTPPAPSPSATEVSKPIPKALYDFGEAVADLTHNFSFAEFLPEDSREFTRLCVEWASEFEVKHAGRVWDGEYIEEIDAFFTAKYAEWFATPGQPRRRNHKLPTKSK
jgi:hypothetical protein